MPSLQFRRQLWDVQKRLSSLAGFLPFQAGFLLFQAGVLPFQEHLRDPGLHKGLNHLLNLMAGPARHKGKATRHATKTSVLIFIRQGHTTICACFLQLPSLFKVLQGHSTW